MATENVITRPLWVSTVIIALLVFAVSLIGIFAEFPYAMETENWKMQAQGQDIGNLLAVAAIIISGIFAKRGSLKGYLIWIGTLFYLLYAYVVYAVAVHFTSLFLVYVAILGLTLYTLVFSLGKGIVPVTADRGKKLAGLTLIGVGVLFGLLWLGEIIPATISGEMPQSLREAGLIVNPIHAIDLSAVLPAFILTGYLVLKDKPSGLFFAAPWLMFSFLMGASIVAAMALIIAGGSQDAWAPMVMVSVIVLASSLALTRFMTGLGRT